MKKIQLNVFVLLFLLLSANVLLSCSKDNDKSVNGWPEKTPVEAVDLGLSVKWANCNVGASNPGESGDYFAWGETKSKSSYDWYNYSWAKLDPTSSTVFMTKYLIKSDKSPSADNKTVLESSDDAAVANWGGSWRMPTIKEFEELRTCCSWSWVTVNGVKGYMVTGKNGNSIFLPVAGYKYNEELDENDYYGFYWSGSLDSSDTMLAFSLVFDSSSLVMRSVLRYYGLPVRPVCQ